MFNEVKSCKYRLPCGWCELRSIECTVNSHNPLVPILDSNENLFDKSLFGDEFKLNDLNDIPNCCKRCPNHPSNGGSGLCNCTLPYFEQQTTGVPKFNNTVTTTGNITINSNSEGKDE